MLLAGELLGVEQGAAWFAFLVFGWLLHLFVANAHLEAIEARTAAMERSGLELLRFSREAAVALRNSRSAESRSLSGRD